MKQSFVTSLNNDTLILNVSLFHWYPVLFIFSSSIIFSALSLYDGQKDFEHPAYS